MIGRVYRGSRAGGLVRYLYGPGRHNEHVDQRLVACWSGSSPEALRLVEPARAAGGRHDCRGLTAELEAPTRYAERLEGDPVWHCPLRTAPGDRVLTDAEWAEVAVDLMHRTGIAPRGDDGGCRWVAVRHDEVSIHVVAVLARQDGRRAHVFQDYPQVRATCLAAERRYGLTVTAPADRTAATHTTRAEVERAARAGLARPARDWLREEVQHAAAGAREPVEFLDRLRAAGVVVRERRHEHGELSGYAVGRAEPGGQPVLFGGRKLAADLSLPRLQARWDGAGDRPPGGEASGGVVEGEVREQLWERATAAAGEAAEAVRARHTTDPAAAGDAAAAAAEVLSAAGRLIEGPAGGPLTDAGRDYDRAARERYGRAPTASDTGGALRAAALQLARASRRPGRPEAAHIALLIAQIGRLSVSVGQLRDAQGRAAQAAAARRAALKVRDAGEQWTGEAHALLAGQRGAGPARADQVGSSRAAPPVPGRPSSGQRPPGRGR